MFSVSQYKPQLFYSTPECARKYARIYSKRYHVNVTVTPYRRGWSLLTSVDLPCVAVCTDYDAGYDDIDVEFFFVGAGMCPYTPQLEYCFYKKNRLDKACRNAARLMAKYGVKVYVTPVHKGRSLGASKKLGSTRGDPYRRYCYPAKNGCPQVGFLAYHPFDRVDGDEEIKPVEDMSDSDWRGVYGFD
jgi:hypothetical protein